MIEQVRHASGYSTLLSYGAYKANPNNLGAVEGWLTCDTVLLALQLALYA